MKCSRCAQWTERYTVAQTRCVPCQRDVDRLIEDDIRRHAPRFTVAKDLTTRWAR